MDLRTVIDTRTWTDAAVELAWTLRRDSHPPSLSWPLSADALRGVTVRWPRAYSSPLFHGWFTSFADGFRRLVPFETADVPQEFGVIVFQCATGSARHDLVIDVGDYPDRINEHALRRSLVYFKMHFRTSGYADPRIVPGGFFPHRQSLYKYIGPLRRMRDEGRFLFDVHGRFGLEFAADVRRRAVEMLAGDTSLRFCGGLQKVRYSRFLREACRSKICLDLPGNADFCCRFTDYFAVGCCMLALKHRTRLLSPLIDQVHIVYVRDDLGDLLDLCHYYASHDAEREEICRNSRMYFDRYLHRDQLAAYYLDRFLRAAAEG